ncbi:hypothetical protein B0J13DRAFT_621229 [Dactylonectria estremocensis]|uniref:F-box domain-containing protein n=1 Tax=Dactylonectria estremocensis TaxID=1079267 RepID=A0A9P9EZE7_9HYPO|nr:hypothetical protein B0J13DRAFT_621229 [Dactylonectria estremocensis]
MDRLPSELVVEILYCIPISSCKTARLTSRSFNAILSKRTFGILISFVDPLAAEATLTSLSRDLTRRRRSIWSPRCNVPEGLPIIEPFLLALWAGLRGEPWLPSRYSITGRRLTVAALQKGLGRADMTETVLQEAMFRYALYLSYLCPDDSPTPHAWVFDFLLHREAAGYGLEIDPCVGMEIGAPMFAQWDGSSGENAVDVKE